MLTFKTLNRFKFAHFYNLAVFSCRKCWRMVALFTCSVGCLRYCYYVGCCCNPGLQKDQATILWLQTCFFYQVNDISAFASLMWFFVCSCVYNYPNQCWRLVVFLSKPLELLSYYSMWFISLTLILLIINLLFFMVWTEKIPQ